VQVNGAPAQSCKGVIAYGSFLTDVVNFIIIGFSVFLIIKTFERLQNLRKGPPQEEGEPLTMDQELLAEIRDLLRNRP
jgi:large conductance mechanosensitive channel